MAICKHADIQAIELFQPMGSEGSDADAGPFKIKVEEGGTVVCFGEKWCRLLLENSCPRYTLERPHKSPNSF